MDTLNAVKKYYKEEYNMIIKDIERECEWFMKRPNYYIDQTKTRFVAVAMFVQQLDVRYKDVKPIFEFYEKKLDLLKEMCYNKYRK